MITTQALIEEAKTWEGTKFQHQARLKGVAVDCVGLISGMVEKLKVSTD